jgi:protein tyrosine phosphatase (PTP) superfamily phosphohydrolase (DUF442 family)
MELLCVKNNSERSKDLAIAGCPYVEEIGGDPLRRVARWSATMMLRVALSVIVGLLVLVDAPPPALSQEQAPARPSSWALPGPEITGVANLYRVTPTLYRSAQPTQEGFAALTSRLGVRTVISLRHFHPDRPAANGLGLRLVSIPIDTWDIDQSRDKLVRALRAVRSESKNGTVLVHCEHGADRTGLIIALYRVLYEGWSKEAAIKEMQDGGYGFHAIWWRIPYAIRRVDIERLRRDVGVS